LYGKNAYDPCSRVLQTRQRSTAGLASNRNPDEPQRNREGRRMLPDNWNKRDSLRTTFFTDRGFTLHEHYDKLQIINMNARMYACPDEFNEIGNPILGEFISVDPLADKYPGWGPYVYCVNNPLVYWDPTGETTRVKENEDGTFEVYDGEVDGCTDILLEDGTKVGESLTDESFFCPEANEGKGKWEGTIDPSSTEGQDFLEEIKGTSIPEYLLKADHFDFKKRGRDEIVGKEAQRKHESRGSEFSKNGEFTVYGSARDLGNYGAGYVAGNGGMAWGLTNIAFELREGYKQTKNETGKGRLVTREEPSKTVKAERMGWDDGSEAFDKRFPNLGKPSFP